MMSLFLALLVGGVVGFIFLVIVFSILTAIYRRTVWEDKTFWAGDCLANSYSNYYKITYNPIFKCYDFYLSSSSCYKEKSKARERFFEEWKRLTKSYPTDEELRKAVNEFEFRKKKR